MKESTILGRSTGESRFVQVTVTAGLALAVAIIQPTSAAVQNAAIWDGEAGNGLWWSPTNWNDDVVPNNNGSTTFLAVTNASPIGDGDIVTINSPVTVDKMGISENDQVHLANGVSLTIIGQTDGLEVTGLLTCMGDFFMDAGANSTDLRITGGDLTTGNNGTVGFWRLSDSLNNRVYGLAGTDRLIVDMNHTIRGAGQIGLNQMSLTNYGYLDAEESNPLILDLAGSDNFNYGWFYAGYEGRLVVQGTTLDNTQGTFGAFFGGRLDLAGSYILGGTFQTNNEGQIRITANDTFLDGIKNVGVINVLNDIDPILMGTIINAGDINLQAAGNSTDVRINSPEVTLTGGGFGNGHVYMSDDINNRMYGVGGLRRLINASDQIIQGSGQIGVNSALNLTNDGWITANQVQPIIVDLSPGENFNNELMQAINGGTLRIQDTVMDNSQGILFATEASRVELASSHIINGQLMTQGSGEVRVIANDVILQDVYCNAHLVVPNDLDPILMGNFQNVQQVDMNAGPNTTDLRLNSPDVQINGPGVMHLSDSIWNRMYGIGGQRRLINASDHTIRGSGQIGVNSGFNLTNNGVMQADQVNALTFDLSPGVNLNNNVIRATNGGGVVFQDTVLDNTAGTIIAEENSRIDLSGSRIFGGTIQTIGTGVLRFIANDSVLQDITIDGHTIVPNDLDPILEGVVTNNGIMDVNALANSTDLRINSPVMTLAGTGEMLFTDSLNNRMYGIGGLRRFVNGPDHTIHGAAQLGVNSGLDMTNEGRFIADGSAGFMIDMTNDFTNNGLLHLTATGALTVHPSAFINSGTVRIDAGKTLFAASGMTMTGGILTGSGVFAGSVNNTGGAPAPGSSVGHLVIDGNYTQGTDASFQLELGGYIPFTGYDVLSVLGNVTLAGTLNVSFVDGFEPSPGTAFTFLDGDSIAGTFDDVEGPGEFDVQYRAHTVTLVYVGPAPQCALADINCDGSVNIDDLFLVIGGWGACPKAPEECPSDLDEDRDTDIDDLFTIIASWS